MIFFNKTVIPPDFVGCDVDSVWFCECLYTGYVHTKPDKFEKATFSPDRPFVHTRPDKFENGVYATKTDKMMVVVT